MRDIAYNIIMFGGVGFIGNFMDVPTVICVTSVSILVLAVAGKLKDFLKAFSIAIKKDESIVGQEIQKSLKE